MNEIEKQWLGELREITNTELLAQIIRLFEAKNLPHSQAKNEIWCGLFHGVKADFMNMAIKALIFSKEKIEANNLQKKIDECQQEYLKQKHNERLSKVEYKQIEHRGKCKHCEEETIFDVAGHCKKCGNNITWKKLGKAPVYDKNLMTDDELDEKYFKIFQEKINGS